MKRILLVLATLLSGSVQLHSAETNATAPLPPNPRLLLDAKGVAELKQRIADATWARAEWNELQSPAEKRLAQPVELPPRGGNWSHNYVCPTHGARLSQGRKNGEWEWEHRCPVGDHVLRGDVSKAALDFDGNAIAGVHAQLARQAVDHGLVFQVTGDARHAARAREILLAYAARYRTYPLHDNQGKPGSGGHVASQSLTEASWLIEVAQGADLVWSTLSEADRAALRDELFKPALADVLLKRSLGIHNIQCRINSAVGLVGFLLGDEKLVARAIDDPAAGYWQQMAKGVLADGMWREGSSGYHFFTIEGVWPLAEAARHCGLDLYGPKFKSMFDAPLGLAMPDFSLPDFNDSGVVSLPGQSAVYELAFARYHNADYVPLLAASNRRNRMAMLFGESKLPDGNAKPLASCNSSASGYAILQQGKQAEAVWLCLKFGPHGGGHGHPDKNHFILFARGQLLSPDGGTHAYGSVLHKGWDQTTVAHNTLIVNETNQQPAQGLSLAFGTDQGVDYSITDAGPIYPGVRFIRTAAMLTRDLILFVDQVQASQTSTFDVSYHQFGKWTLLPPGKGWPPPSVPGYCYLQQASARMAGVEGITLKTSVRDDWQPAIVLAGGEPTEIITGYGILKTTEQRVPWLLQRRRAQATAFVWALSLKGTPVRLTVRDVQDKRGAAVSRAEAVQVEVRDDGRQWQLLINPNEQSVAVPSPDAKSWSSKSPFVVHGKPSGAGADEIPNH